MDLAKDSVSPAEPFVIVTALQGGLRVAAADAAAEAAGVVPGMALADARALYPGLRVAAEDSLADQQALAKLAAWCSRYSPWASLDRYGERALGLFLDITGCAHLFGGEEALLADLIRRLAVLGVTARAAAAATPGAAWALARFASTPAAARGTVVASEATITVLADLPVLALRIEPETAASLDRVGLKTIGALAQVPRATLTARYGAKLLDRLDAAFGLVDEPISPLAPAPALRASLIFAEPVAHGDDIERSADRLLAILIQDLAGTGLGARRMTLAFYRTDGEVVSIAIGTSRPTRDLKHLRRLFAERLDKLDLGFGADAAVLAATVVEKLPPEQIRMRAVGESRRRPDAQSLLTIESGILFTASSSRGTGDVDADLAALADRLGNRLGITNVVYPMPVASHLPERAVALHAVLRLASIGGETAPAPWHRGLPRPVCLFLKPEPIVVMAPTPDHPPVLFRWRKRVHRVTWSEGPERVGVEWWRVASPGAGAASFATRDYFRVEDETGRRFWLYRSGLYRASAAPVMVTEDRDADPEVPHRDHRTHLTLLPAVAAAASRFATPESGPAWFLHGLFA